MKSQNMHEIAASWDRAEGSLCPTACFLTVGKTSALEIEENSPGLCPGRVRSRDIEFWHRPFPFFRFFWNSCNCNQLKQILIRIRAIIRARAIVVVELCAREAASRGATGHDDNPQISSRGGLLFWSDFRNGFFSKMVPTGASDGLKNVRNIYKNETWNEVHKTCWTCAKFDTLGLAINAFSNGTVATNH